MDERLKGIVNNLESMKIGLDEPFKFHCTMCSKCCINREDILLSPRGSVSRCPLLKNRKCMVHKAKPTVCAMYPIGRYLVADNKKEGLKDISKNQIQYIFNNPGCGDNSETQTVREYLESFGVSVTDDFFRRWQQVVLDMSNSFRKIEKVVSQETMELVWTAAFQGMYLHYDIKQNFMSQFESNSKSFFDMLNSVFSEGGDKPVI